MGMFEALRKLDEESWGQPAAVPAAAGGAVTYPLAGAAAPGAGLTGKIAQLLFAVRKSREKYFPGSAGSESCWLVLLQLYAANVYQYRLHIQGLTERTGAPPTTVLRALDTLVAAGFATRTEDRFDRRRVVVELTEKGASAMKECLLNSGSRAALF